MSSCAGGSYFKNNLNIRSMIIKMQTNSKDFGALRGKQNLFI
jgi:hypothetical protein